MKSAPNILVICSDQHTPGITGCYGDGIIDTPNLDRLAREGTLYTKAYCNQPVCVPSRMSFMTGKYPSRIGVLNNSHVLDSRIPTYAHMLAGAGYRTVLAGRMHFMGPDQYHGFQERIGSDYTAYAFHCGKINRYNPLKGLLGNGGRPDPLLEVGQGITCTQQMDKDTTGVAVEWLSSYAASGNTEPFLMTVGYFSPHCPYIAGEEYYRKYAGRVEPREISREEVDSLHPYHKAYRETIQIGKIPAENIEKATAAYYGLVDFLDNQIGMLLDAMEGAGLLDNTAILYFSDHGEMLGEHGRWHKSTFFEASCGVPLIIRTPSGISGRESSGLGRAGSKIDAPVSLVDIFPTVCDLAGREVPFEVDGTSLLRSPDPDRPVFSEYHDSAGSHRMIRKGSYKLNYYAGYESFELFNLEDDPGETINLSGTPSVQHIEEALRDELFRHGWSGEIKARHDRYLESIGFTEIKQGMSKTQALIEDGSIVDIPGYKTEVSWYENKLENDRGVGYSGS